MENKHNFLFQRGDNALHIAVRGRSKRLTEYLLRNPKNARLLYNKNKNDETAYEIDATHERSVLTQVFGASEFVSQSQYLNKCQHSLLCQVLPTISQSDLAHIGIPSAFVFLWRHMPIRHASIFSMIGKKIQSTNFINLTIFVFFSTRYRHLFFLQKKQGIPHIGYILACVSMLCVTYLLYSSLFWIYL